MWYYLAVLSGPEFDYPSSLLTRRPVWLPTLIVILVILLAFACVWMLGRAVPVGQRACLHVWTSLAVEVPLEQAVDSALGERPAAGAGRRRGWLWGWGEAFRRWIWQAEARVDFDHGGVMAPRRTVGVPRSRARIDLWPGGPRVYLLSLAGDGGIRVKLLGEQFELTPGQGVDLALVPEIGGSWIRADGDWRRIIADRLAAGLPVGRLSLVNLGVYRSGEWPDG